MKPDHAAWRERVLGYEELEPGERVEVDAHLQTCPSCRELLNALQARESQARPEGRLSLEPAALMGQNATDEHASAERLLQQLAAARGEIGPRPVARAGATSTRLRSPRPPVPVWAWLAPAAAAAALAIVFWAGPGRDRVRAPRFGSLAIEHASTMRGSSDLGFRTGDAFSIRFELTAASRPIVVALDDSGAAEVLYPPGDSAARLFPAGTVVLPDSAAAERWTFTGPPGRETFLAGSLRGATIDLAALRAELVRARASASERTARVRAARAVLEKRADSVGEITVSHAAAVPR
jgi:hypothetical protein